MPRTEQEQHEIDTYLSGAKDGADPRDTYFVLLHILAAVRIQNGVSPGEAYRTAEADAPEVPGWNA